MVVVSIFSVVGRASLRTSVSVVLSAGSISARLDREVNCLGARLDSLSFRKSDGVTGGLVSSKGVTVPDPPVDRRELPISTGGKARCSVDEKLYSSAICDMDVLEVGLLCMGLLQGFLRRMELETKKALIPLHIDKTTTAGMLPPVDSLACFHLAVALAEYDVNPRRLMLSTEHACEMWQVESKRFRA